MAVKHTFKAKEGTKTAMLTTMKAIREKCKDCSNWFEPDIRGCVIKDCALYPFRMGRRNGSS